MQYCSDISIHQAERDGSSNDLRSSQDQIRCLRLSCVTSEYGNRFLKRGYHILSLILGLLLRPCFGVKV